MDMREEFFNITKGWASNGNTADLTPMIKDAEAWAQKHQPLQPGEEKTIRLMHQAQAARVGLSEGGDAAAAERVDDFAPDAKGEIECGLRANGRCTKDGGEECKRCPQRQSDAFVGSKAWKKKHGK